MKKFFENLNDLKKMLLLGLVVGVFIALIMLLPLFIANQPGWLIGVAIGTAIELLNILLLYKGSDAALKSFKTSIFLIFYFLRMTLFIVGFLVAAIFSFGLIDVLNPVPFMAYSLWGVLIAYTPTQIIVIIVMIKNKKNVITISEKKEDK